MWASKGKGQQRTAMREVVKTGKQGERTSQTQDMEGSRDDSKRSCLEETD